MEPPPKIVPPPLLVAVGAGVVVLVAAPPKMDPVEAGAVVVPNVPDLAVVGAAPNTEAIV